MTAATHPNLDRIAQGIRDRREPDTERSTTDALRDLMRAVPDTSTTLARLAQRNAQTPTTETDI